MASILRVNTITDASSNNSTAVSKINQGTASMWAKATQSDNSIFDSYNLGILISNLGGQK